MRDERIVSAIVANAFEEFLKLDKSKLDCLVLNLEGGQVAAAPVGNEFIASLVGKRTVAPGMLKAKLGTLVEAIDGPLASLDL